MNPPKLAIQASVGHLLTTLSSVVMACLCTCLCDSQAVAHRLEGCSNGAVGCVQCVRRCWYLRPECPSCVMILPAEWEDYYLFTGFYLKIKQLPPTYTYCLSFSLLNTMHTVYDAVKCEAAPFYSASGSVRKPVDGLSRFRVYECLCVLQVFWRSS